MRKGKTILGSDKEAVLRLEYLKDQKQAKEVRSQETQGRNVMTSLVGLECARVVDIVLELSRLFSLLCHCWLEKLYHGG